MMFHPVFAHPNIEGLGEVALIGATVIPFLPFFVMTALFGQHLVEGAMQALGLVAGLCGVWRLSWGWPAWFRWISALLALGWIDVLSNFVALWIVEVRPFQLEILGLGLDAGVLTLFTVLLCCFRPRFNRKDNSVETQS